jgi:hypothetical protein
MTAQDTIRLHSKTTTASILTALVVILLIFDGIMPHLPTYDLRTQNSFQIRLFFVVEVFACVICQVLYLQIIKTRYILSPNVGNFRRDANITHFCVSTIQYTIIALLIFIVLQIQVSHHYNSLAVSIATLLSLFLCIGLTSLLAFRFIVWLKYGLDRIVLAYAIVMIMITVSSLFLAIFISLEMRHNPSVIDSSRIAVSTSNITDFSFKEFQSYISAASFVSLWIASVLLLNQARRKWGNVKFWLLVAIPLVYYFGAFQLILSFVFSQYGVLNPVQNYTFDLVNSILTRPLGGVLFGIAFWTIAKGINDKNIKYYLKLSAFGIVLLSISNVDTGLFMLPYPPFGLPALSFLGISSYLLLVGIYNSAISVSLDDKVRSSIQKSVEQELKFVSKIGSSQMQRQIENKVKTTTKKLFKELEENSGVNTLVDSEDINEYIVSVIKEKELFMSKRNNNNNKNKNNNKGLSNH